MLQRLGLGFYGSGFHGSRIVRNDLNLTLRVWLIWLGWRVGIVGQGLTWASHIREDSFRGLLRGFAQGVSLKGSFITGRGGAVPASLLLCRTENAILVCKTYPSP